MSRTTDPDSSMPRAELISFQKDASNDEAFSRCRKKLMELGAWSELAQLLSWRAETVDSQEQADQLLIEASSIQLKHGALHAARVSGRRSCSKTGD